MGWPESTADMRHFFPGHLLETGHDILFFWVVRMVFMAQELCGQLPFKEVWIGNKIHKKYLIWTILPDSEL